MIINMVTNNARETAKAGINFAKTLVGGEVVLMIGDLGAGKTTFVQGAAKQLKVSRRITSPTFVLMKVYKIKKASVINFVHLDTYRGLDISDLENVGALEYFGRKDSICFVEWGNGLEPYLQNNKIKSYRVIIKNIDEKKRQIDII